MVVLSLITFGFLFSSIYKALPPNVVEIPIIDNLNMTSWFPQGWGFYSKDPTEGRINVYDENGYSSDLSWPNSSSTNLFGLKKEGRADGIEAGMLFGLVPEEHWIECNGSLENCLQENKENVVAITNTSPRESLCGKKILTREEYTPWLWSSYDPEMPLFYVEVDIECLAE
ncbi:SdpA family antimicrobial peptide system protein [Halalkalibacter sp. AB-rgal2]|uniref:SdpA family antimicrobial peptide system protein n=1 Tax=Halalkalibacter sp. AB-rgal2 TaxID=3242695 RepID=UPI00359F0A89